MAHLNFEDFRRNLIFAIENHFNLVKLPPKFHILLTFLLCIFLFVPDVQVMLVYVSHQT